MQLIDNKKNRSKYLNVITDLNNKVKYWTKEEEQIVIDCYLKRLPTSQTQAILKHNGYERTRTTIYNKVKQLGIARQRQNKMIEVVCKKCGVKEWKVDRKNTNKEYCVHCTHLDGVSKYKKRTPEKERIKFIKHYFKNKNKIKEKIKKWREKNKEHLKEYYLKNKENKAKYIKEYYQKHKEEYQKYYKQYYINQKKQKNKEE